MEVVDTANNTGFKDGANTGDDYAYDLNGNLTLDKNKGITNIRYNYLNLPTSIVFSDPQPEPNRINYYYSADGAKQQKRVVNKITNVVDITDYAGNYIYEKHEDNDSQNPPPPPKLQMFFQPEGYVQPVDPNDYSQGFEYVYNYTDHLGNIRLSYADLNNNGTIEPSSEILDEKNYYPFGGTHAGYNTVVNSSYHPYGFGGKEEQDELGLEWMDFGARNYDKWLGRWHVTDGKAELYFANSPYVYALNTPIQAFDPDGNLVIFINGLGGGGKDYWRGNRTEFYTYTNPKNHWTYNGVREVPYAFDLAVSRHLGDNNRRYVDGSPGSIFNNFTTGQRYKQGYEKGSKQAAAIIGSLARDPQGNITETIKIITHSMGGVYGKGFVAALKYYIKTSDDPQVRKALITLVADFDPFQAGSQLGRADDNTFTQQFINEGFLDMENAGFLANQEEEGADEVINNENKSSHFIETFIGNIDQLQEGTYEWNEDKQEWICTTCKN